MSKTATFIKLINTNRALFKLSEPLMYDRFKMKIGQYPKTEKQYTKYVVSSISNLATETYLFSSDDKGDILSWVELEGSEKGILNFTKPLKNAGYKVLNAKALTLLFSVGEPKTIGDKK